VTDAARLHDERTIAGEVAAPLEAEQRGRRYGVVV
jgi:hypothetical protein